MPLYLPGTPIHTRAAAAGTRSSHCGAGASLCARSLSLLKQVTWTREGLYITYGATCNPEGGALATAPQFLSVLLALPKAPLYAPGGPSRAGGAPTIMAAVYPAVTSWWASVPLGQKMLAGDAFKPANNYIEPVRPQTAADEGLPPLFVMKVRIRGG